MADPTKVGDELIASKYWGRFNGSNLNAEYQVVSMLIGAFWSVEHAVYYKPDAKYKDIKNDFATKEAYEIAVKSLCEFDKKFTSFVTK